jgi:hypothetical protein
MSVIINDMEVQVDEPQAPVSEPSAPPTPPEVRAEDVREIIRHQLERRLRLEAC